MVKRLFKIILLINVALLPVMIALNLIRASSNPEEYKVVDYAYFVWYVKQYPVEDFEHLKTQFNESKNLGAYFEQIDPDWSGGFVDDLQELATSIGQFFKAIFYTLKWLFEVIFVVLKLVLDTFIWVVSMPYSVINYN